MIGEGALAPQLADDTALSSVALLDGLASTRTIRRYTDQDIPTADLSTILWHASRAPSGSNRQPVRYVTLRRDPISVQAKKLLGDSFRASWTAKSESDGYATGTGTVADSPKARMAATMQHYVDHIEAVPVIILVCMKRHRHPNPYEGASVYPACQNLLLAARAMGYGGALTLWHQQVESSLRSLLSIPDTVAISACITLGVPAGHHGPVRRLPLDRVVFDGAWDVPAAWASEPADSAVVPRSNDWNRR